VSFRRRMIMLAAGAVAAAVVIASVIVYVVTRDDLRRAIDASLKQKLTPGGPQAVQIEAKSISPADVKEAQRLAAALATGKDRARGGFAVAVPTGSGGAVVFHTFSERKTAPVPVGALQQLPNTYLGTVTGAAKRATREPGARSSQLQTASGSGERGQAGVKIALPAPKLGGPAGYAQLLLAEGNVLRSGEIGGPGLPMSAETLAVAAGRRAAFFSDASVAGTHVRVFTTRAPIGGGVWQVALPLTSVDSTLADLRWVLGGVSVGGILLAGALGLLVSRAALAPVRRLRRSAEQVARTQDLAHRIAADGDERDELGRLATSFNTMLASLESSRLAQRQLISDASHELRTPLTSVRANLDALAVGTSLSQAQRARVLDVARGQLAELTVLVGDLVDLSKTGVDSGELEDVRLDLAVAAAVTRARARTHDCRYVLHAEPCIVRAAPSRLDRAITNLLDNACKWGAASGPVEVSVGGGRVSVRDQGPGIADEDLPRVFDRFYRAPNARGMPGSGLGLAIVRHFAETHDGSVHAANDPAGGARLTLELPALEMTADDAAGEGRLSTVQPSAADTAAPAAGR
jgi:two-component system, OmpR family, sensor histidine kinase MprB